MGAPVPIPSLSKAIDDVLCEFSRFFPRRSATFSLVFFARTTARYPTSTSPATLCTWITAFAFFSTFSREPPFPNVPFVFSFSVSQPFPAEGVLRRTLAPTRPETPGRRSPHHFLVRADVGGLYRIPGVTRDQASLNNFFRAAGLPIPPPVLNGSFSFYLIHTLVNSLP